MITTAELSPDSLGAKVIWNWVLWPAATVVAGTLVRLNGRTAPECAAAGSYLSTRTAMADSAASPLLWMVKVRNHRAAVDLCTAEGGVVGGSGGAVAIGDADAVALYVDFG